MRRIESEETMTDLAIVTTRLRAAGFVAADEEALELLACSNGDATFLDSLLERRLHGEPLAWITGFAMFCGLRIEVVPGVYVPRWQTEPLARRAASRLPPRGLAIDVCTGSGAIATYLMNEHPDSRVVATDLDGIAVACATSNGVEVFEGDLFDPLPSALRGRADVIVGVAPYVPTYSMHLLPRDTFAFETTLSYDGGEDGAEILRRVLAESPRYLRRGGALLLELGGDEAQILRDDFEREGFGDVTSIHDEDGDVRGIEATLIA